ncbi:hypothetical protein AB0M43_37120 [Longispora sp. NPDC051575]|uniref:hypothetical protein n=1 Tax=Longispora sp. NPDC051575 TaxID=3154943 RepID=UPI00341E3FD3
MTNRLPRMTCVIGPPAAGKTTLTTYLHNQFHSPVLRPRDAIAFALQQDPGLGSLFARDNRGWVLDPALGLALRITLARLDEPVILEGLPWDAFQLADLHQHTRGELTILRLRAPTAILHQRRSQRMFCATCYPKPATGEATCQSCGGPLTTRADDDHEAFHDRLDTHRSNAAAIQHLAADPRIPAIDLDTDQPASRVATEAFTAIGPSR